MNRLTIPNVGFDRWNASIVEPYILRDDGKLIIKLYLDRFFESHSATSIFIVNSGRVGFSSRIVLVGLETVSIFTVLEGL